MFSQNILLIEESHCRKLITPNKINQKVRIVLTLGRFKPNKKATPERHSSSIILRHSPIGYNNHVFHLHQEINIIIYINILHLLYLSSILLNI